MSVLRSKKNWFVGVLAVLVLSVGAMGQESSRGWAANVVMPQSRAWLVPGERIIRPPAPQEGPITITQVEGQIKILEQVAITTLKIHLKNDSRSRQEAELIMPVPDKAIVRSFTYEGAGEDSQAQILPKEEARRIYDGLVAKIRDPALLEFIGYNLVRSSVFPVEAQGTQWVKLTYEHLLETQGDRIDYVLPRSELLDYQVPWKLTVEIKSEKGIATVYSASHELIIDRKSDKEVQVKITRESQTAPGAFRLSYLTVDNGMTASMFAYPDPKVGGGYFLLLAGLPAKVSHIDQAEQIKREVTLVIDRSGSMNGEKIEQVRAAALQIIAALEEGEAFNIIVYENTVETFAKEPVIKDEKTEKAAREYIKGIRPTGGTNIHDALVEALRQKPQKGMLPIVLFLTDGLPTVGQTSEKAIRESAQQGNKYERRIFTFGVGVDVNVPLLEKIAEESRAKATFVLPKEDVEVKVGQVFKRLSGPIMADTELEIRDEGGKEALGRTRDIIPAKLPDLFAGDQLVLLGQYVQEEPLTFVIGGNYLGREKEFEFTFDFEKATVKNAFVPRLWASRKIAELIDAVRQLGADGTRDRNDPKVKELVDEIVRLSTEFGILTEYTAFLAREGVDVADRDAVRLRAGEVLEERAMGMRSGAPAVSQSFNLARQKAATLNYRNEYFDEQMGRVSVTTVQQVNDRAFYRKDGRWVDSRLVSKESLLKPDRVIEFGSDEFGELLTRLVKEGRQASIALQGDILMEMDGEAVLIRSR